MLSRADCRSKPVFVMIPSSFRHCPEPKKERSSEPPETEPFRLKEKSFRPASASSLSKIRPGSKKSAAWGPNVATASSTSLKTREPSVFERSKKPPEKPRRARVRPACPRRVVMITTPFEAFEP